MLTGIHFLLTYMCNLECDHCFVYSGPDAKGTFTLGQIRKVLNEATKIGTIKWIYFEGGAMFRGRAVEKLVEGLPKRRWEEFTECPHEDKYVDVCHFCYLVRLALINRFPQYLAPRQVYGLE